ncbi:MAG: hypothetical protein QNJ46_05920 [Leptolyngbyaceae cyanobacterium MO_188.B28]|nr:hypothetical protein [Leptolyngbyaceae cyanobacterium MO_188.B28]
MAIKAEIISKIDIEPVFLRVQANVRYWEDADVNGVEDTHGTLMPHVCGEFWTPTIRLSDGLILDWPQGTTADIHYKVCDQGEYFLLDKQRQKIAKWRGYYVPDDFLCHGSDGYGDYIIFEVNKNGVIENYKPPHINPEEWEAT